MTSRDQDVITILAVADFGGDSATIESVDYKFLAPSSELVAAVAVPPSQEPAAALPEPKPVKQPIVIPLTIIQVFLGVAQTAGQFLQLKQPSGP